MAKIKTPNGAFTLSREASSADRSRGTFTPATVQAGIQVLGSSQDRVTMWVDTATNGKVNTDPNHGTLSLYLTREEAKTLRKLLKRALSDTAGD